MKLMRHPTRLVLLALLLVPGVLFSQEKPAPPAPPAPATHGSVEFGVQGVTGDVYGRPDLPFTPSLLNSKFNEYSDRRNGFVIRKFDVTSDDILGSKNYVNLQSQSTIYKDQSYLATFGQYNKFKIQFAYDETPHIFTNLARTLFTESSPGVFTVPAAIRSSLTPPPPGQTGPGDPTRMPTFLGQPFDLTLRRKVATVGAGVNLTPEWTLGFRFSNEKKTGARPLGTYNPGFEFAEPTNYRTNQIQAGVEYAKQSWAIQFNYLGSLFENKVSALVWDNAFANTGQGRIALYPDNSAHDFDFAGALSLGKIAWLMASITPGWMHQNDAFLPFTINPGILAFTPGLGDLASTASLPAQSLNGSKQTLAMNYTVTGRPLKDVSLTARYRSYDYNNNTPSLFFPTYVIVDVISADLPFLGRGNRQSLPYGFNRKNVELTGTWEFLPKKSFKVGYEFERYDRQHRDVRQSDEHTFLTSWDLNLNKQTLLRISYRHSQRNPDLYTDNKESFPLGEGPFVLGQMEEFRRFDEAARVRDRADALLQYSPLQSLTLSSFYGTIQDNYNKSEYGLLKDISYSYGFGVDYSPRTQVAFFGEYTREKYKNRLKTRQVLDGSAANIALTNTTNNDWASSNRDLIDTWSVGTDVYLARRKITWTAFYSLSAATGQNLTTALGNPSLPGFLVTSAENRPDTKNRFHQVVGSVKFALSKNISPKLEYRYEQYDRVDWQTQVMNPYMFPFDSTAKTQTYLGADTPSYRGHFVAASLEYRF